MVWVYFIQSLLHTDHPENGVSVDLGEDKRGVVFKIDFSVPDGGHWGRAAAEQTCRHTGNRSSSYFIQIPLGPDEYKQQADEN